MFSWFLADKPQQKSIKFNPKVQINTKSSLFVQVQPKDPTTTSNIIITAFTSFQNRTIVPIKVQWSRFKLRSQAIHSVQKINGLIGNTYMCEPNDVGGYIKAIVRTTDEYMRQQAQVTIGPIAIDVMIKRVIDGALYSGSLLSQVVIWQKDKKNNVNVRLYNRRIQFIDEISQEKLVKDYTLSEPKIQLNPKDPTRIYLRFEQDQINEVRDWLNKIFHLQSDIMDESSLSIRVPYSSTGSSKVRLFQKTHNPCSNKFQMRFISRLSRDLFLFTQRAFICKEDMKNSIYIQKLQTLQNLTTEQDYHKFLEYISLKLQILRLADYAKEVQEDRNSKVKDLVAMQESIGQMTLTYLKIIEQKGKHQKIDLEVSYSQINHTRQQIMNRKNVRQLKNENQKLKNRLREMNEEIQLLKFFKKQDNQSMIFNQTSNPFAKKQNQSINVSPQDNRKNMYQISINYANLLQENKQLKKQMKMQNQPIFSKQNRGKLDHSQNMIDILGSLQQKEEQQAKFNQYQNTIRHLKKQIEAYRKNAEQMQHQINNKQIESNKMIKILNKSHLEPSFVHNHSVINQSINSAASDSFMNHTVTSEMAIAKLQENLNSLHDMNNRLQDDNTRLRRQRDYFKSQYSKIQSYLKQMSQHNQNINNQQQYLVHQKHQVNLHNNSNMLDQSTIHRYRQQNQALQNERNSLLRKVQSLAKQNNNGLKEQFLKRQKIIKQLQEKIQQLLNENKNLSNKQTNFNQEQLQLLRKQNSKIKKVNLDLLQDIKSLKIELQNRIGDNMYNSRVIQLENQLGFVKKSSYSGFDSDKKLFIDQINDLTKTNIKLKKQNQDKQLKLNTQALTIEKLMLEHSSFKQNNTPNKDPSSLSSTNSKEKSYSQKCNQSSVEEVQKYKRQVKKLQQQIIFIKKSSDAINRSRDLTMEMDGYYEEKIEIMKRQMDTLYVEIQNVGKMCQRYRKEALEANKELMKWRQKAMNLMKIKDEDSLLIN